MKEGGYITRAERQTNGSKLNYANGLVIYLQSDGLSGMAMMSILGCHSELLPAVGKMKRGRRDYHPSEVHAPK